MVCPNCVYQLAPCCVPQERPSWRRVVYHKCVPASAVLLFGVQVCTSWRRAVTRCTIGAAAGVAARGRSASMVAGSRGGARHSRGAPGEAQRLRQLRRWKRIKGTLNYNFSTQGRRTWGVKLFHNKKTNYITKVI